MGLNTNNCNNIKYFIREHNNKDYGLLQVEKSKHIFSVAMMLVTLQFCSKNSRLKQPRSEILKHGNKEYKLMSAAINCLESTLSSVGEFTVDVSETMLSYLKDVAATLENDYVSYNEILKDVKNNPTVKSYLKSLRNCDSLYRSSEKINLAIENIKNLKGEEKSLRLQETLFFLGEYLKNTTSNTPNIGFNIWEQLRKSGVPVDVLNKIRDIIAHKQMFLELSDKDVNNIVEALPALKDVLK